jgi:hypothetical protein
MNHVEGAPRRPDNQEPIGQGHTNPSEAGKDYIAALRSIRTDQDTKTFVADLRQNKEQLLSSAQKLKASILSDPTSEELTNNAALGVYLEVVVKQFVLDINLFSSNPADYPDEDSDEPLTQAEQREMVASWATRRVALKWVDDHPGSEAANEVIGWNIYGFPDQHHRLLQEMWPSILPQLTSLSEKKNSLTP